MISVIISILKLFTGRTIVRRRNIPLMLAYLKEYLREHEFAPLDRISDSVGMILIEEALRRAAEKAKDGYPRSNEFFKQTELIGDHIIAASRGDENTDTRINDILVFHNVI